MTTAARSSRGFHPWALPLLALIALVATLAALAVAPADAWGGGFCAPEMEAISVPGDPNGSGLVRDVMVAPDGTAYVAGNDVFVVAPGATSATTVPIPQNGFDRIVRHPATGRLIVANGNVAPFGLAFVDPATATSLYVPFPSGGGGGGAGASLAVDSASGRVFGAQRGRHTPVRIRREWSLAEHHRHRRDRRRREHRRRSRRLSSASSVHLDH